MNTRMNVSDAAAMLGIHASTLRRWRLRGFGPPFTKVGPRNITYHRADVEAYLVAARIVPGGAQ